MKPIHTLILALVVSIVLFIFENHKEQQREKNREILKSITSGVHNWVLAQGNPLFQDSIVKSNLETESAFSLAELKISRNFAITGNPLNCEPLSGEMVCVEKIDTVCVAEWAKECLNVRLSEEEHSKHHAEIYASRLEVYPYSTILDKHTVVLEIMEKCIECGPCYNKSYLFYFSGKVKDNKFVFETHPDVKHLSTR